MKKEYVNPSLLFIEVSADIDTVSVSDGSGNGDGIVVDLNDLINKP